MAEENHSTVPEVEEEPPEQDITSKKDNLGSEAQANNMENESTAMMAAASNTDVNSADTTEEDGRSKKNEVASKENCTLESTGTSVLPKEELSINNQILVSEDVHQFVLSPQALSFKEGFVSLLLPAITEVDKRVLATKESQQQLRELIEAVSKDLQVILSSEKGMGDLEPHINKLNVARRRLLIVDTILQNVQERLVKLGKKANSEITRRRNTVK